jgi:hypothetical protein
MVRERVRHKKERCRIVLQLEECMQVLLMVLVGYMLALLLALVGCRLVLLQLLEKDKMNQSYLK